MTYETVSRASATHRRFTVLLSPTRRGARLARLLTTAHLADWGLSPDPAAHVVAELANNAATHGRVSGRDFQLNVTVRDDKRLRIEVTDTRSEQLPTPEAPADDAETGRGLLIVDALADRWGVDHGPVPRKTVWAEIDLLP
ncbi:MULTISPECIES: ATP-binding protein [Streptomyces]|uniref:ATP-binding protein n=1 Tax=Streptomyces TaxID=1883 RepID=UPI000CD567D8|nr:MULTISPECIES: ATP-binding protein [unclassified Streptomyces]AWL40076.1 ATP-binding protein [Streptomyces sp. SM18]